MGILRLLLVVLLLVPSLFAYSVSFNTAYQDDCLASLGGCAWENATLWSTLTVPAHNDTVLVAGLNATSNLLLFTSSDVRVLTLTVSNAWLTLGTNTSLFSSQINLDEDSGLEVSGSSKVSDYLVLTNVGAIPIDMVTVALSATLLVRESGTVYWVGLADFFGNLTFAHNSLIYFRTIQNYSPAYAAIDTYFAADALNISYGASVSFPNGLYALQLSATYNSSVTISRVFVGHIYIAAGAQVHISDANVTLAIAPFGTLFGEGVLFIVDSTVVSSSSVMSTSNCTLVLGGTTTINLQNITLPHLNFTTGASVVISGNGLVLSGDVVVPGQLIAYGESGVTITGTLIANGPVLVNNSQLVLQGALVLPASGFSFTVDRSQIFLGGLLHASVVVSAGSELIVTSDMAQVVGTVVNQAVVNIGTTNALEIYEGDYIQENTGTISVGLSIDDSNAALVVKNGSIFLNGTIKYTTKDKPFLKSAKFLVATANGTINGTFVGDATAVEGSQITEDLDVEYNDNDIYIEYPFRVEDVEAWVWAVFSAAVVVFLVGGIAIIVQCRKRSKYQKL